ncbi:MAG TPA: fused MFS/spermidine synthase [Polyangia bacterium]
MRELLLIAVILSGFAGLSWEVLWQIKSTLALGVSARGTALTLVITMGGMSLGAAVMGRILRHHPQARPGRVYALLEIVVALSGLAMLPGFGAIETVDSALWQVSPRLAPFVHLLSILFLLGGSAVAMGATLPVFGALASRSRLSVATLYAANTGGATLGVLAVSLVILPAAGVALTTALMVSIDLLVSLLAWTLVDRPCANQPGSEQATTAESMPPSPELTSRDLLTAFVTGTATFLLEVAWFRSLRATFQSTTDSFAIMLAAVLGPLALGAAMAPTILRRTGTRRLPHLLAGAGILVLGLTPAVERLDQFLPVIAHSYELAILCRLLGALLLLGPPVFLLGTVLPVLLAASREPSAQGRLYALSTVGAIVGSLAAAWLLLPTVGATATACIAGLILAAYASVLAKARGRAMIVGLASLALLGAFLGRSGVGRLRVQSQTVERGHRVLAEHQGPDATVSTIELANHDRVLVIDGFETTAETATAHYMAWMGRLPMLLHPNPRDALVICFGTGQTAAAIEDEQIESLDVVELDAAVLGMSTYFPSNHGILAKPNVHTHVMDGRAWLRRTDRRYDVVTLEPMSPEFAGTNALYSVEFYRRMERVLKPGAIVAQWVPFHIVPPAAAAGIVAAFVTVFPDALLWVDPRDGTGIVVGRRAGETQPLGQAWPGFARPFRRRDLSPEQITASAWLGPEAVARYASLAEPVDDDNQALAYGRLSFHRLRLGGNIVQANFALLKKALGHNP